MCGRLRPCYAGASATSTEGAKPFELLIEQVSKCELVVDLRLARGLGIEIPQSILVRADEVIR